MHDCLHHFFFQCTIFTRKTLPFSSASTRSMHTHHQWTVLALQCQLEALMSGQPRQARHHPLQRSDIFCLPVRLCTLAKQLRTPNFHCFSLWSVTDTQSFLLSLRREALAAAWESLQHHRLSIGSSLIRLKQPIQQS